jgi:hypothetical protein
MATLLNNDFTSYTLTSQEEETGHILSFHQKCILQNRLYDIVSSKLLIEVDTNNIVKFTQDEAYLRGQMEIIKWLLDCSTEMEGILAAKQAETLYPE